MISLGLIVRRIRGIMCSTIRANSRVCDGCKLIMWFVSFPRWVVMIMYMEYSEVIRILQPRSRIVGLDQENNEIVINSSPIRLIEGGRARFARLAKTHRVAISGNMVWSPRVMIMVRLWIRS